MTVECRQSILQSNTEVTNKVGCFYFFLIFFLREMNILKPAAIIANMPETFDVREYFNWFGASKRLSSNAFAIISRKA